MRTTIAALAAAALFAAPALSDDGDEIAGSYLLTMSDHHRILTFTEDHTVSQISNLQEKLNFTAGSGAWSQARDGIVTVRLVDFSYDRETGAYAGPAAVVFQLTFADERDDAYHTVAGEMTGKQFGTDTGNPLTASADPIWSFSSAVTGVRITAE